MLPTIKNQKIRCILPGKPFGAFRGLLDDFLPEATSWRHIGNMDVYEDDKNLYVEVELPGFKKDQIDLVLEDDILHLKAEPEERQEEPQPKTYYIRERREGRWSRSIQLPAPVQGDQVAAVCCDGVLKITLAKHVDKQSHKIPVT